MESRNWLRRSERLRRLNRDLALHRQTDLSDGLPNEEALDCTGDSHGNPPRCRERRPCENTNESRFVFTFWQDFADQRLVNLVRRLCKHEGEPGEGTIPACQT